jgi:predicted nucleic acid-binding protein
MNGKTLVLDTNAVIKLLDNEECSRFLDDHFPNNVRCVSVITQIELLAYPDITQEADKLIRFFLADIPIITIEAVAKLQFCNSNLLKMHVSSDFSPQALA